MIIKQWQLSWKSRTLHEWNDDKTDDRRSEHNHGRGVSVQTNSSTQDPLVFCCSHFRWSTDVVPFIHCNKQWKNSVPIFLLNFNPKLAKCIFHKTNNSEKFLISWRNHVLWPLIWIGSTRRFKWVVTIHIFFRERIMLAEIYVYEKFIQQAKG